MNTFSINFGYVFHPLTTQRIQIKHINYNVVLLHSQNVSWRCFEVYTWIWKSEWETMLNDKYINFTFICWILSPKQSCKDGKEYLQSLFVMFSFDKEVLELRFFFFVFIFIISNRSSLLIIIAAYMQWDVHINRYEQKRLYDFQHTDWVQHSTIYPGNAKVVFVLQCKRV